ncbi:MAG: c-type cytochrome, partial [Nitrospinota bacterium]|nr:c-type cytochrome [Nitrospinota bacterium]
MIIFLLILTIIMISPLLLEQTYAWNTSTPVSKVLEDLGDPLADHAIEYTEAMVQRGKDIVLKGQTIGPDGSLSEKQSVYFVCTDCHNIKREDPDPRYSDPTARLSYAKKNNLQFLPATTLYGMVNRTSWFNDSYILLYGDTILPGHKNLRKAVQICSEVCSSGRRLKKWELDSLMAYFWTIELKLGDLNLSADDWKTLKKAEANPLRHKELIPWLKSFYFKASPATFDSPPERLSIGYRGLVGDPERGEDVYKLACLNCHAEEGGSSHYELDLSIHTIRPLYENRAKQNRRSFYNAIRDGIYFKYVRPYMPQYSLERMTDQQIEDLNAYLESKAKSTVRSRIASDTTFDFSDWDALLKKYTYDITKENVHLTSIKYIFLKNDKQFKYLIRKLEKFPVNSLKSSNEKLSFWINVYNIMAVKIISDHYPVKSIQDIGTWFDLVWNKNAGIVGGKAYS